MMKIEAKNLQVDQDSQSKILKVLRWAYEASLNGLPKFETAVELAESYLSKGGEVDEKVNSLIRWQISKTSTAGFLSGIGGIITLPVAFPVNVACVIYVQMRMIAAIAHMGNYDVTKDNVKALSLICLAGNEAQNILKSVGINVGTKFSRAFVQKCITGAALLKINQAVGAKLITKFGVTGVAGIGKAIPIIGGVIGATFDGFATYRIGVMAKKIFIGPDLMLQENKIYSAIHLELQKIYAYINIIKIDGNILASEIGLLDDFVNASELSNLQKEQLIAHIHSPSLADIDLSLLREDPGQALSLLKNLIKFSKIDGEVHPLEESYIQDTARKLGFDPDNLNNDVQLIKT
ncbi:MAG: EcsC family protein [Bacteroidetes bacterium]|nr:EcsC family protein [Bacteroidota bacterium]